MSIHGVVFDLDDTLYPEAAFVDSGFRDVARWLSARAADGITGEEILRFCRAEFKAGRRRNVFDKLVGEFAPRLGTVRVDDLVRRYREHTPEIDFWPEVRSVLADLKESGRRLGLISDGWLSTQELKVKSLGLAEIIDPIVLTDRWGAEYWKPHPRAFGEVETALRLSPAELAYVGDNPAKDFLSPRRRGWRTIRLRRDRQIHAAAEAPTPDHAPHMEARYLSELPELLNS